MPRREKSRLVYYERLAHGKPIIECGNFLDEGIQILGLIDHAINIQEYIQQLILLKFAQKPTPV